MDISKIDNNFKVETNLNKDDIKFYDAKEPPFRIYGVFHENGTFRRVPEGVAKATSEGVAGLSAQTAGGRVRFKTNSPYVAISAKMSNIGKMPHFAFTGSVGFDLYVKQNGEETYYDTFIPPVDIVDGYESVIDFDSAEYREITINMPLYSGVKELYIGVSKNADIKEPTPYKIEKPIVYYGSSITQGGCASRPGTSYEAFISRALDTNYINLGFSGSALAEDTVSDYIKDLDMSAFVLDYDHNAPSIEHLEKTHEKMFKKVREANPELPIIMLPRPKVYLSEEEKERREIVRKTYENAIAAGDKNVYFIDGLKLMSIAGNEGTVDVIHPTDLGFFSMATALIPVLEKIFYK